MTAEIVPGLYRLPGVGPGVNSYVWQPRSDRDTDGGPLLFDCGYPWGGRGLVASLRALGCRPEKIHTIAITHDDVDHTGRLASLVAVSGAEVIAHRLEAPRLASDRWRDPPVSNGLVKLIAGFANRFDRRWPHHPVRVDRAVRDGETVADGWIAVFTPGHTPGHTSYFHQGLGVLIAGDAMGNRANGRLKFPMAIYTEDIALAACSIRKLAALESDIICFGHGPVLRNAAGPLRKFAEQSPDCARSGR